MQVTSKNILNYLRRTFKTILFVSNLFVLLLLLSSFLAWHISPARVTLFAYIGLGFLFVLLANIMFVILWGILLNWKIVLFDLVIMTICHQPITTYFPMNFKSKEIPENSIKVLSYNVKAFNWKVGERWEESDPMIQYLKSVDADIICMQEYIASTNDKYASSNNLQKVLGKYPYYSVIPFRSTRGGYEYGLACFSKYPIKSILEIPVTSENNGSALYNINVNGKIITVVNNHFESNRLTSEDKKLYKDFFKEKDNAPGLTEVTRNIKQRLGTAYEKRAPQVDIVAKYIQEQKTDALIVCGDFNDTPISYTYNTIKENLLDAYAETGFGPGITYHENYFWFRIDFIMHSKNLKAYNCTVDKVKYSDHYPIWTYLHFK